MILASLLLMLQAAPPPPAQPPLDTVPAPWPDPEREMGRGDALVVPTDEVEARRTMASFADCVVAASSAKVADVLVRDFRTTEYRNGLRNLSRDNQACARKVGLSGRMRMGNLPFAGALAEEMLGTDAQPLLRRLSMAALGPAATTYSWTDGVAMCMARGAPQAVAQLFDTAPGSAEERTALAGLKPVADICAGGERKFEASALGLRSMLATATYRLLAAQKGEIDA